MYKGIFIADEWTAENGFRTDGSIVDTYEFDTLEDADFGSESEFRDWLISGDGFGMVSWSSADLRRIVASVSMTDTRYIWRVENNRHKHCCDYIVWESECAASVLRMRGDDE